MYATSKKLIRDHFVDVGCYRKGPGDLQPVARSVDAIEEATMPMNEASSNSRTVGSLHFSLTYPGGASFP